MKLGIAARATAPAWSALLLAALLGGCHKEETAAAEPARPASVPAQATFVGGLDGGVFLLLQPVGNDLYQVKVFLDSGVIAYEGRAKAATAGGKVTVNDVAGWDGQQLQLKDGGSLTPTDPIEPIQVEQ